ncbi:unnamed protein product [Darwinula stevensoni]|uniref:Palmitoyltransferase n=1 Tax=Darwinula stevensoni TaxID=69355 RepID=A0A7R8X751_9CRUS|nr:unnamed protein product [Darwinula stevensoni]CAG0880124.1 unnamed protein product [Darwinula stevensoni]
MHEDLVERIRSANTPIEKDRKHGNMKPRMSQPKSLLALNIICPLLILLIISVLTRYALLIYTTLVDPVVLVLTGFFNFQIFGNWFQILRHRSVLPRGDVSGDMVASISGEAWCSQCHIVQPVRVYHCPLCNRCVARRDHHCFALGVCIGQFNHAHFVYFLGHAALSCCIFAFFAFRYIHTVYDPPAGDYFFPVVLYHYIVDGTADGCQSVVTFLFNFTLHLTVSLSGFCGFNVYLICRNRTQYEFSRGRNVVRPDRSARVFGPYFPLQLLIPVHCPPIKAVNLEKIV